MLIWIEIYFKLVISISRNAIPMVMGTNVGTSITSSIVSITHIKDMSKFERAFSCAIVHDFFNWLTVIFLFTLEMVTQNSNGGVLYVSIL